MHVARVSHLFYPDIVSDYLFELSMQQVRMGHEVDVLTWNKTNLLCREKIRDAFMIYRLPGVNFSIHGMITEYPYLPGLPRQIETLQPEVVHAESHLFYSSIQAIKTAKNLGIPCVVTVHGIVAKRSAFVTLPQYAYLYTFGSWLFKKSDRVICLTESDAKELSQFGCPSEKIRIIPNAVDTNRFKPAFNREDKSIVWVGRFVPEKGLKYLIEAAAAVVKQYKDVIFLLIGDGPCKLDITKLSSKYALTNNVFFLGSFNRDQVASVLGRAAISVLPSLKEGLPLSLLEAMSCGTAVVASKISGVDEIVRNNYNGILVPPRNPKLLANAIIRLLRNEDLRKELGLNARKIIKAKFGWPTTINSLEQLYNEITIGTLD